MDTYILFEILTKQDQNKTTITGGRSDGGGHAARIELATTMIEAQTNNRQQHLTFNYLLRLLAADPRLPIEGMVRGEVGRWVSSPPCAVEI